MKHLLAYSLVIFAVLPLDAAPFVYTANLTPRNAVSVIDAATNTVVQSIKLDVGTTFVGARAIASTADGRITYVITETLNAAPESCDLQAIDTDPASPTSNQPIMGSSVPLNQCSIDGIAVSPDGRLVYMAVTNSSGPALSFDTHTHALGTIPILGSTKVVFSPDGSRAYFTVFAANVVVIVDTGTGVPIGELGTGGFPTALAITPDGTSLVVANFNSNTVSIIPTSGNPAKTVKVAAGPRAIAATPEGNFVLVTSIIPHATNGVVSKIDINPTSPTFAMVIGSPVTVGFQPEGIAITPDARTAYVSNYGDTTVSVLDIGSNALLRTIPVLGNPTDVAIPHIMTCHVTVPHWKQFTPWGDNPYDQSYRTINFASQTALIVPNGATLTLTNGFTSCDVVLPASRNHLSGLSQFINGHCAGVSASDPTPEKQNGTLVGYYLSLYNTACLTRDCSPRVLHSLQLQLTVGQLAFPLLQPKLMRQHGCNLTSLAMALAFVHVSKLLTVPPVPNFNPSSLDEFMSNTLSGLPLPGGLFSQAGDVLIDDTVRLVGRNIGMTSLRRDIKRSFDSIADPTNAYQALDNALCSSDPHPMIVGVELDPTTGAPGHYVLVTGKLATQDPHAPGQQRQYEIEDPGRTCPQPPCTLNGNGYVNQQTNLTEFVTRGIVRDPAGDISELNISVDDRADVLITDSTGRRTGFDPVSGHILQEIPGSTYYRDSLIDDTTGGPSNGVTHSIEISTPAPGTYTASVIGLRLGSFTLSVRPYSADGTPQPPIEIIGIAGANTAANAQIQYALNMATTVALRANFQSTLADIQNSLALGWIDNNGIANSLGQKIQAASQAIAAARGDILIAFEDEVKAQAGKHVSSNAAQMLLRDADSLLTQNP